MAAPPAQLAGAQPANANAPTAEASTAAAAIREADRLRDAKDLDGARRVLTEARRQFPGNYDLLHRAAIVEHLAERYADARALVQPALTSSNAPSKLFVIAIQVARRLTDTTWAEATVREALRRWPSLPEFHHQLGLILSERGKLDEACWHFEAAINLQPYNANAQMALAVALERMGDLARAEFLYRSVIAVDRRASQALINLGVILQKQERHLEALEIYRQAEQLPHQAVLHSNLGALYRSLRRYEDARASYAVALKREPNNVSFLYNFGNLLKELGDLDGAAANYRRALAIAPDNASVHWNLSLALLAAGRLAEGFQEYEWRWQYEGFPSKRRDFPQPMWDGGPAPGKALLIHTEQGMGDVLQYMRFMPAIVERAAGARIVFECHQPLMRLFSDLPGVDRTVERLGPEPLPPFDLHMPLMSATHVLGIATLDQLPKQVPYIPVPDPTSFPLNEARPELLKIGLVWAGNPRFSGDRTRSTQLATVLPLLDVPGTQFFSLQKGDGEAEVRNAPAKLIRLNERIRDFCDTAAAMMQLNLIITTCTSVVHLAGALGRPTWVMLCHAPDWRWLLGRDDSPWYPTARLFRQSTQADWPGVIAAVRAALTEQVRAGRAKPSPS
ncbi:MAG: tetratricopeptide repeat protein [Alphaproteobacteria bacterium]|nr:tetratricopeptide repeat protein [Alphaproteobacteria bacterium]